MSESYLSTAITAAEAAGELLREEFGRVHQVDEELPNDLKLALDVQSQEIIAREILRDAPDHAILGEEGSAGHPGARYRWVVDPIDGTVNFFYGIPHFAVSIALQEGEQTVNGVILDPMLRELWSVDRENGPRLGSLPIRVSNRSELSEAIVMVGFAKSPDKIEEGVRRYRKIAPKVRKIRMLGSAALAMAYVASGRLDAYVEETVSLWDVAAGTLLVEAAGGTVKLTPHVDRPDRYSIVCWNGKIPIESLL